MPMDYGVQRQPRRQAMIVAGVVLALAAIAALVFVWATDRAANMAHYRAWTVNGPPCVSATATPAMADAPIQIVSFQGVSFARAHGAIQCAVINFDAGRSDNSYPICQFDHPGRLKITTPKGVAEFQFPPLIGATVSVEHAAARCVVGVSRAVG